MPDFGCHALLFFRFTFTVCGPEHCYLLYIYIYIYGTAIYERCYSWRLRSERFLKGTNRSNSGIKPCKLGS